MPGIDNSFINSHSKAARDLIDPRGRPWQRRSAPPSFSNRRGLLPLPSPPTKTAQTWKRKRTPLQERDGVSRGKKTVSVSLFCRSCSFQHWRRNREEVWGVRLIDFSRGPRRSCNAGRKIWQERWFGNYGIEIMHQKYGITVCDAFISFVCGREEEGNAKYRVSNKSCKNQQRWFQWDSRNRSRLDIYIYALWRKSRAPYR